MVASPLAGAVRWRLAAVGLLVILSGCGAPPQATPPAPPKVTVERPVEREIVEYQRFNGWMDASQTVDVRSRVRGHIQKVHFTDGQLVEKGAPLFDLDPRPFEVEIETAKGQQNVVQAETEYAIAEEVRQRELYNKNVVPKSDYEKAVASRKALEAKVEAAKQEVGRKELDLVYAKITAPISGKISRAMLTEGNLVNAGGTDPVLTTIVSLNPIHVYFHVDEKALLQYRKRDAEKTSRTHERPLREAKVPFEFGLETERGFPNKGILDYGSNRIDPATGTIEVRGEVDNSSATFLPGSRVRVQVPVSDPYKAIVVPDSAILSDQDKRYVLSVNAKKDVIRRDVQLGKLLDDGMRVILPGADKDKSLKSDDWIIVLGLQRARVNEPVEPVDANGAAVAITGPAPAEKESSPATAAAKHGE